MNQSSLPIFPQLILQQADKILLLKRSDSAKIFAGYWHLPTGKIEKGESPLEAMIRETKEEIGILVEPQLILTVYNKFPNFFAPHETWEDLCLFFKADASHHQPINVEPQKHSCMEWFELNNLPSPFISHIEFGIQQYAKNIAYAEYMPK